MLHARNDYNRRIQDSENVIPENEPVFLLRGQDIFAPILLELYAAMIEISLEPDEDIIRNTQIHASVMRKWQDSKIVKFPNMDNEDSVY